MRQETLAQMITYGLTGKTHIDMITPPHHPNGVKNGTRSMFKQNKRAEAKRRSSK